MKLNFGYKCVSADVREHLQKAIKEFGEEGLTPVKSLSRKGLNLTDDDSLKAHDEKRKKYHSV